MSPETERFVMELIESTKKFLGLKRAITDSAQLRKGVLQAYSEAATNPQGQHPFPVGRWFAESIGYPTDTLDSLPPLVAETFTGVSNVSIFAEIPEGSTVLDIGCGAGLDTFIASQKTGIRGHVIGIDFSDSMIQKAREASSKVNLTNIEFYCAAAEKLPISKESVDVILVNGIFNLNPFRDQVFRELARVTKTGGSVYAAELVLKKPQRAKKVCKISDWFS
jgi:arsenite methyltransferase